MIDMIAHLTRQAAFSRATFGPGPRTEGVLDHIAKESQEVRRVYAEGAAQPGSDSINHVDAAHEWVDIAILGLDGLLRALSAAHPTSTMDQIAAAAASMIVNKQGKNELRKWPDWRGQSADKAIEHQRGHED